MDIKRLFLAIVFFPYYECRRYTTWAHSFVWPNEPIAIHATWLVWALGAVFLAFPAMILGSIFWHPEEIVATLLWMVPTTALMWLVFYLIVAALKLTFRMMRAVDTAIERRFGTPSK